VLTARPHRHRRYLRSSPHEYKYTIRHGNERCYALHAKKKERESRGYLPMTVRNAECGMGRDTHEPLSQTRKHANRVCHNEACVASATMAVPTTTPPPAPAAAQTVSAEFWFPTSGETRRAILPRTHAGSVSSRCQKCDSPPPAPPAQGNLSPVISVDINAT